MKEVFAALVKAQAEIGGATKDKTNPHFKSKYADLGSVVEAIKPIAAKYGLGYIQVFSEREGGVAVETIIIHESGESFSTGPLFLPATKHDAQGYGSAITYARRYSLQTAFGVPSEDDDGNAAVESQETRRAPEDPRLRKIAEACKQKFAKGDEFGAYGEIEDIQGEDLEKLWAMLSYYPALRASLKKSAKAKRDAEEKLKAAA